MDRVIKEGTLRLLTAESTCDVILCCQGQRLMAHKVILSMASQVFRDLLTENLTDSTVIILPDIPSHTMSLILDYIYTGNVLVFSNTIQSFLSLAKLLKIHLHLDPYSANWLIDDKSPKKEEEAENFVKTKKKLPQLIPIHKSSMKSKGIPRTNSCVLPSPWTPRSETVLDPRDDFVDNESLIPSNLSKHKFHGNDPNNNSQLPFFQSRQLFSRFNQTKRAADGELNAAVSRPPEEVAVDRDKNGKEGKIENWMIDSLKIAPDDLKEESNGSVRDGECFSGVGSELKSGLSENERSGDRGKPYECEKCGKCFSQLRNFKYHRSVHEGTKEFAAACSECGKTFNDKGYLSSHMKIHRDKKEYACQHCPKRFNQRVAYNMHLRIHTGLKPHECPTCGKSFSRKMLLKQHQRVHTGERPYSCPECGKTFADRSNMSLHARLHTGVKPYACSLCPKSFTKKHHLKTHMNFHTGVKPYNCEKCGLAFSQSSNMRTHYKKCTTKRQISENVHDENKHSP